MLPQIPSSISNQDELNKSTVKVLSGNVSPGSGLTFDANEQPLTFDTANTVGAIFRIGSTTNPLMQMLSWPASTTNYTFAHNLNAIPYGYIVIAKSGPCDVYWGSIPPTDTEITLQITDSTQDTTIWILC